MSELDTIMDFCDYLHKKENLMAKKTVVAAGEEELLAYYVRNVNTERKYDFIVDSDIDGILFDEGIFEEMRRRGEYVAKKEEDNISYAWDSLIEYFNSNYAQNQRDVRTEVYERVVRIMASLRRVERRVKARKFKELWSQTPPAKMRFSLGFWTEKPQIGFAFLAFPRSAVGSHDDYIKARNAVLHSYCGVAKVRCPQLEEVVGIAIEPGNTGAPTLGYCNFSEWTDDDRQEALQDQRELGLLTGASMEMFSEREYPQTRLSA